MPIPKYAALLLVLLVQPVFAADVAPTVDSIKQLLAVMETRKLVDGVMTQMDERMKNSTSQALHGQPVTPEQHKIFDNMQNKTLALLRQELAWDSLEPMYIRIYRESFTQDEVDGMLAFYKSPAGHALIAKMPVVIRHSMAELDKRMGPLMQKLQVIQQETLAELKAASAPSGLTNPQPPRRRFISSRVSDPIYLSYLQEWRKKVLKVGNASYPEELKRKGITGSVLISVDIMADGSLGDIEIRRSSRQPALDKTAKRIVQQAAPFAPLPPEIRKDVDILNITTTWKFSKPGDQSVD